MEYTEALERLYAEWEQQVQQKGREQGMELGHEQGMELGMRKAFVTVYQARFGRMSDEIHAALALVHEEDVFQRLAEALGALSQGDVDAAIRAAAASA